METTNPAARLHQILLKAKLSPGGTALDLWAKAFGLLGPELVPVICGLLQLQKLIEETYVSLRSIEGLPDRYFRLFERIRILPTQSLKSMGTDLRPFLDAVTEGDMDVLEFCAERLEERHAEPIIDEEELQKIAEEVNTLFDEVKTSAIDPDLKTFILDGLESIRRGIFEFRIRGPQRLREAISEILASYIMNQDVVKDAGEQESWQKFNETFSRLVALVSFASNAMHLITGFTGPLLPGSTSTT